MNTIFIITTIIFILIVILLFKLIKKVVSAVLIALFLLLLFSSIIGLLIYQDVTEFNQRFKEDPSLFILIEGNDTINVISAVSISTSQNTTDDPHLNYYPEPELSLLKDQIEAEDYDNALGENYKLFLIKIEALQNAPFETLNFGETNLTKEDALNIIKSDTPFDTLAERVIEKENLNPTKKQEIIESFKEEVKNDNELKSLVFLGFVSKLFGGIEGPIYMITQYKKGNIIIHEESILFKGIKYGPSSLIQNQLEKTKVNIQENKDEFIGNAVRKFQ